jgi:hypothetical protein
MSDAPRKIVKKCDCENAPKLVFDAATYETLPRLKSIAELHALTLDEKDGGKHRAAKMKFAYDFDETTQCQFCGTWHKEGNIVETCCGRVFQIGWICAEHEIEGMKELRKAVEEGKKRAAAKENLRIRPSKLIAELDRVFQFAQAAVSFRAKLARYAHELHDEVLARLKQPAAKSREVLIADRNWRREGRDKPLDRVELLNGLELFRTPLKTEQVGQTKQDFEQLQSELGADPEMRQAEQLEQRLVALGSRVDKMNRTAEASSMFADDRNLHVFVRAVQERPRPLPDGLEIVQRGFRVRLGSAALDIVLPPW